MENEGKAKESKVLAVAGYLLAVFLFFLYYRVTALYGLKFAASFGISLSTGVALWLLRLLFHYGKEDNGSYKDFSWRLFLLFPLFIPLALPLWLIPLILVAVYLLSISAFGGYGRHIFNPIVLAVVFMLHGYGDMGVIHPSRPLPKELSGYKIWTAGIPPTAIPVQMLSDIKAESAFILSMSGLMPNVPGSSFGAWILMASFLFSLFSKKTFYWWLMAVGFIFAFASFSPQNKAFEMPGINPLLFGIIPSLILSAVADSKSLPKPFSGQVINASLFGFFSILFLFNSSNILAPAYGFLLAQILSPLAIDLWEMKK